MTPSPILFVCLGNAVRSQIAQAFVRHFTQGRMEAESAGIWPLGQIPDMTRKVMREKGIPLDGHTSKGLDAIDLNRYHLVVNMSGIRLDKLSVPVRDWPVPDPYGNDIKMYRGVCNEIEEKVVQLLDELYSGWRGGALPE